MTSSSIGSQCSDVIGGIDKKMNWIREDYRNNSCNFEAKLMRLSDDIQIVLLKLLMSCNNSLRVTALSLSRSKYRKNRFVINEI